MHFVLFLLIGWATMSGSGQAGSGPPCRAWLQATSHGNMLELTANCSSLVKTAGQYRYEMSLERQTSGGSSSSQQSGAFTLAPGQSAVLSSMQVNVDGQSSYSGHLRVFDARNTLLAQDSVYYEPGNK